MDEGKVRTWTQTQREGQGDGDRGGEENLSWNPPNHYPFLYPLVRAPWCPRFKNKTKQHQKLNTTHVKEGN